MNCPKCGKKMQKGFLVGGRSVVWSPKKLKFRIPLFEDDEAGITIIVPLKFTASNVESHICKDCRITVTKY